MTPSEVYSISHNSNYFYNHFYDENVLKRLGKSKMNTVCMKDGSYPELKYSSQEETIFHHSTKYSKFRLQLNTNVEIFYVKSKV